MNTNLDYVGKEKREYPRIQYVITNKPKLKIGKRKYEVLDISQRGLRFIKNEDSMLPEYIDGKLTLLCGESIPIEGLLVWEQDDDFALYLKNIIPSAVIQKEKSIIQERS